jgi:membrane fusion protein, multidrug efflux system
MLGVFRRFGFAATVAVGLGLMVLVVVGKTVFSGAGEGPGAASAATAGRAQSESRRDAPQVVAVPVARHTFSDAIQALGTAQARESIVITPKVADTIRAIRFDSGQRVRRGQVLVEMSNVEQAADLSEARAAADAAQDELRRYQELYDRGFASQARLDTVRAAADAAQARLEAGGSRIADRTLRAPFAGTVGLRTASPGQYVRPGDQIGTLDDVSEIKLDFDVPETRIAQLREGVAITARTAAFPDRSFEGVIANVDSRVNPTTRTISVRAILPNPDETLRAGMLMTVVVQSNPREAIAAPETAILDQADGAYVYAVRRSEGGGQTAELTRVEFGQRSGGMAEIVSGLNEGDLIVTEGLQSIRPGQAVRLEELRPRAAETAEPAALPPG